MNPGGGEARVRQKDWVLTEAAFNGLLAFLDADRERAAEKYEQVRQKLTRLFQWRGCARPEECADRTLDRVARRVAQGLELEAGAPYTYIHGVALNVLREYWRDAGREPEGIELAAQVSQRPVDPLAQQEMESEQRQTEARLSCLENCIRQLPIESRQLLAKYHGPETVKIGARKRLAAGLGIPLNTLRTRACRIRGGLESCVDGCVKRQGAV